MATKKHAGKEIREVWDWRLSRAAPILYNSGPTWEVRIYANDGSGLLEAHDTGIPTMDENGERDPFDEKAVAACYDWLRTVRDKYSRDHIELRKPVVAMINAANEEINKLMTAGKTLEAKGKLQFHNLAIKKAVADMHEKIAAGGVQ